MCDLCERDNLPTETCGFEYEAVGFGGLQVDIHEFELCTECLKDREESIKEYKYTFFQENPPF